VERDPLYQKIGSLIQRRRKLLDMKQHDLAGKLGISRGSLANIETGRQSVLVHQLYKFANTLDLAPADLLPPVGLPDAKQDLTHVMPRDLDRRHQEQIARIINGAVPSPTQKRTDHVKTSKH